MDAQTQTHSLTWHLSAGSTRAAALARLLDEAEDGVVDDELWDAWVEQVGNLTDDLATAQTTRQALERIIRHLRDYAAELVDRARRAEVALGRLEAAMRTAVIAAGGRVDAGPYTLTVTKPREVVEVEPDAPLDAWPEDLVRTKREPKKRELLAALQGGVVVEGARVVQSAPSLRVRAAREVA